MRAQRRLPPTAPGLTSAEAAEVLARVGPNVLPRAEQVPVWRRLTKQFVHFFALLLWVAAALAIVGGMPALGVAIVAVVLVNGVFAFVQENRAERAAAGLRDLLPVFATVLRDGREQQVTADLIVPGDVVLLVAGDRITADMTCLEAQSALVDTSTLTGESAPREVAPGDEVFAGCFLVQGRITALVRATGAATRLGGIARLTQQPRPATPLERDIAHLVRMIAIIAGAVGVVVLRPHARPRGPRRGRVHLRDRRHGRARARGAAAHRDPVPGDRRPADGRAERAGAPAGVRRDPGRHHLHLHRQDRDPDREPDERGRRLDARWARPRSRVTASARRPRSRLSDPQAGPGDPAAQPGRSPGLATAGVGRRPAVGDPVEVAIAVLVQRLGIVDDERPSRGTSRSTSTAGWPSRCCTDRLVCKGAPEAILAACDDVPPTAEGALAGLLARGLRVLAVAEGPRDAVAAPARRGHRRAGPPDPAGPARLPRPAARGGARRPSPSAAAPG